MSQTTAASIARITEVVQRVTRILSDRQISVVQMGMKVGVEYDVKGAPTKVYLPSLSENPSPELVTAIQGFLDKEVSTLLYTDFDQRYSNATQTQFKKGMAKSLQSIIEDARTERAMRHQFKGSATNFDKNHDFATKEILQPVLDKAQSPEEKVAALAFPAVRAACGDQAYREYMKGKWEDIGKLGGAILHYADEIQNVADTQETFDLTRKIIQKMEEMNQDDSDCDDGDEEGEGEGDNEGEGQGDGDSDNDETGDGDEDGDGEGQGDDSDDSNKDEDSGDKKNQGNEGDSKGDQNTKAADDRSDLSKSNKSKKKVKASQKKPTDKPGGSNTMQGVAQFDKIEAAFQKIDFNAATAEKIKKIAGTDANAAGAYTPYTRQYDYIGPLPRTDQALNNFPRSHSAKHILDAVDKNSHVIQQQVQKLFMARELKRWEPGHKRGHINAAALHRLSQGDPKVFRRRVETNGRDVAVALVIDMSGSMHGPKVQNAIIAALMFSKVLTALSIKHEISAFSTYSGYYSGGGLPNADEINKVIEQGHYGRYGETGDTTAYSRYTPITNYILKGWTQRLNEDIRRTTAMIPEQYSNLMSGNVDGESIDLVGRRLLAQKEKKKVMIVMSDGAPASDGIGADLVGHLKKVVKELNGAGVEMLGLGLQNQSVKAFYPKYEIVMSTDEIPKKILELTRKMVVGV